MLPRKIGVRRTLEAFSIAAKSRFRSPQVSRNEERRAVAQELAAFVSLYEFRSERPVPQVGWFRGWSSYSRVYVYLWLKVGLRCPSVRLVVGFQLWYRDLSLRSLRTGLPILEWCSC